MNREQTGTDGCARSALWGRLAGTWATAFAALHFYWALGGDVGLDTSAGPLATERRLWFVIAGLWGVGALCLLGTLLAWSLTKGRLRGIPALPARRLAWAISALLLTRGIGIEVLLLTHTTHLNTSIGDQQQAWTLALWNPWFIAGGLTFGLAALHAGRQADTKTPPTPDR
ncbi:DUF3995 domain-containing protein [Streptomyces sp. 1222.5]|uniref:DUF3995 domain-containing protein n=1 Tax=Streptomyces sp. 1222.5 TaxID=1881026 RepID=UPI003D761A3C